MQLVIIIRSRRDNVGLIFVIMTQSIKAKYATQLRLNQNEYCYSFGYRKWGMGGLELCGCQEEYIWRQHFQLLAPLAILLTYC